MTSMWNRLSRPTLSELLLRAFRKSAKQEAEKAPPEAARPPATRHRRRREENVNPPTDKPKDNLSAEERARRVKAANRAYFKAAGMIEAFYFAYPGETPPGHMSEEERQERAALRDQQRAEQRERNRGGRGR